MTGYIVTVTREGDLWVARAAGPDGTDLGVLDFDNFTDMHMTMPEYLADMVDAESGEVETEWRMTSTS